MVMQSSKSDPYFRQDGTLYATYGGTKQLHSTQKLPSDPLIQFLLKIETKLDHRHPGGAILCAIWYLEVHFLVSEVRWGQLHYPRRFRVGTSPPQDEWWCPLVGSANKKEKIQDVVVVWSTIWSQITSFCLKFIRRCSPSSHAFPKM